MELLDLYDDKGKKLNKTVERGKKFDAGNIMISIIFIKNKDNKYLIQKTSKEKGSKYSSTGGHVTHGETGLTTIIREIKEELGININPNELEFISLVKHPTRPFLINLYLLEKDVCIDQLKLQKEEVESVTWLAKEEILNLIKEHKFLESHGYLFQKYINKKGDTKYVNKRV